MQYDPEIMFECDGCGFTESVIPDYVYNSYSGESGRYDDKGARIPDYVYNSYKKLIDDHGWVKESMGYTTADKHYCSTECKSWSNKVKT